MRLAHLFLGMSIALTFRVHAQTVDFDYTQSCLGDQTTFVGSSSLSDTAISAWNWDLDNDGAFDDATGKTVVHLFGASGSFTVSLEVVPNAGTASTTNKPVVIDPLPQVNFIAENLCEGQTAFYSDASVIATGSIGQYNWDFDNDGITDDTGPDVTYICGPAQNYQSKLTCISDKGCEAFAIKTTSVRPVPTPNFSGSRLCALDLSQFKNQTQLSGDSLSNCLWDFGDGSADNSIGDASHEYSTSGEYQVTLVAIASSGCRDSVSKELSVEALPFAAVSIAGDPTIYGDAGVEVSIDGDQISSIAWPNGSTNSSTVFNAPGDFEALVVFENGCQRKLPFLIDEELISRIEVLSDLITPNGDGINETLVVKNVLGGESCSVLIVDRWNKKIYESADYQNDWNGNNGNDIDAGAYFYRITCGEREPLIGNINLLK